MIVFKDDDSVPVKIWVDNISDVEESALSQLKNLARLPFIAKQGLAVMADCHSGKGSTVGTVIATDKAIIPAAVGVDLGCGCNAVRLSIKSHQLPDSLASIRSRIESMVPVGNNNHTNQAVIDNRGTLISQPNQQVTEILDRVKTDWYKHSAKQLGTLGGGNHFIELCIDENQDVWIMLHSGSRGIGNVIGSHFITKAKETMEKYFINLPDADLAYLPEGTEDFDDYVAAVNWAQDYALENRKQMMIQVIDALRLEIPIPFDITLESVSAHHNYVEKENHFGRNLWVTRKGAIRARQGELGVILGSMGARSFIVRGKGNTASFCTCSHGAGRTMSRTKARQHFTVQDLIEQTRGIECLKTDAVLDEIPGAYKPIDWVMSQQTDLIEVVHSLKQVLCVKGS